jgi:ssDNA-binding Zn-finger/Zn-ribbon topoisomerase 1
MKGANVNVGQDEMPFLPCLLCGKKLDQRTDKNGKFYFVCDPCGTQYFVRREQGIEKLEQLIHSLREHEIPIGRHAQILYEIQAILSEIDGLKSEIEKLDMQIAMGFFIFADEDKIRARNLLKVRVENLLSQLEQISKRTGSND